MVVLVAAERDVERLHCGAYTQLPTAGSTSRREHDKSVPKIRQEGAVVRYSPGTDLWGEPLSALQRIQEEINRAFGDQKWSPPAEFPPINIWRGPEGIIVTAEIPGVSLDAVDLAVHQNTLTIKGRREPEAREPEAGFHRRERTFGPFSRTIPLPFNVDPEQVKATAQNGILTVELPRPESDKPRKIKISQS